MPTLLVLLAHLGCDGAWTEDKSKALLEFLLLRWPEDKWPVWITQEILHALITDIEGREWRPTFNRKNGIPQEHPRSSTTDESDVVFFSSFYETWLALTSQSNKYSIRGEKCVPKSPSNKTPIFPTSTILPPKTDFMRGNDQALISPNS